MQTYNMLFVHVYRLAALESRRAQVGAINCSKVKVEGGGSRDQARASDVSGGQSEPSRGSSLMSLATVVCCWQTSALQRHLSVFRAGGRFASESYVLSIDLYYSSRGLWY